MKPCQMHLHGKNNSLTRRRFLEGIGLAAAGLVAAGCQPRQTEGPDSVSEQSSASSDPTAVPAQQEIVTAKKTTVAIAKANNYDPKLIRSQLEKLLDDIGGVADIMGHGNRVAIKTNLTGGTSAAPLPGIAEIDSYLTHPEVVAALVELLRDAGAKDVFIVEAVYEPESWPAYGYQEMAKRVGATLVDLTYPDPYKDFAETPAGANPVIYEAFKFNPILNEIDAFVSVSKMKCHNVCGVTHTMKNLVGLVPYRFYKMNPGDQYRSEFHGTPDVMKNRLPNVVIDLNRARPVNLSIIDGILTAEAGEGPWITAMTPIQPGVLFAGKDPVATDSVATAAMGFDPTSDYPDAPFVNGHNHLAIAAQAGMGTNKLEDIKVIGPAIKEISVQFKPSY